MTDWADGIETKNYGIKGEIDAGMFSDLIRTIIPLVAIAGTLLFYSWIRSQIVNVGYETQRLVAKQESLLRTQKKLDLEKETLTSPVRIDVLARVDLGMTPLRPSQFILPQDEERGLSNKMAMADSEARVKIAAAGRSNFIPAN